MFELFLTSGRQAVIIMKRAGDEMSGFSTGGGMGNTPQNMDQSALLAELLNRSDGRASQLSQLPHQRLDLASSGGAGGPELSQLRQILLAQQQQQQQGSLGQLPADYEALLLQQQNQQRLQQQLLLHQQQQQQTGPLSRFGVAGLNLETAAALLQQQRQREQQIFNARLLAQHNPFNEYMSQEQALSSRGLGLESALMGRLPGQGQSLTSATASGATSLPVNHATESKGLDDSQHQESKTDSTAEDERKEPGTELQTLEEDGDSANADESSDTFPFKLYRMLAEAENDKKDDIVSFFPHGRAFAIHKPRDFVTEIMPKYFTTSRMSSFQRQLNLYGFRRITEGVDKGGYFHENFLKGRKSLCGKIKRKKSSVKTPPNLFAGHPSNPQAHLSVRQLLAERQGPMLDTQQFAGNYGNFGGIGGVGNPTLTALAIEQQQQQIQRQNQLELMHQLLLRRQEEERLLAGTNQPKPPGRDG